MNKSKNDIKSKQEYIPVTETNHVLTPEEEKLLNLMAKIIVDTTLRELQELKAERKKADKSGNTEATTV